MAKKRKNKKPGICVYCGNEALLTEDHIPPKTLFPASLWGKLLKIPSCSKCNNGASKDDEYVRTIIGLSAKGERDETLKPLSEAAVRALARPEASGFRQSILGGVTERFAPSPAGVLRPVMMGNVDLERFDRVVARIIKGIFYVEQGVPLGDGYELCNYSMEGFKRTPFEIAKPLLEVIGLTTISDPKQIGGPQFTYWSQYNPQDRNQSAWVLAIHRHHFFAGWTVKVG